jgi:hypothetical protein
MKQTYRDLRELAKITIEEAELKADYSIQDRKLRQTIIDSVGKLLYKFQEVKSKHG